MERLMEEVMMNLPQVFIENDLGAVKEELQALQDISSRFRSSCKVNH